MNCKLCRPARLILGTLLVTLITLSGNLASIGMAQQPAPSYDVTVAWIQAQFNQLGGTYPSVTVQSQTTSVSYSFISMSGCTLQYSQSETTTSANAQPTPSATYTFSIPLASVSAVSTLVPTPTNVLVAYPPGTELLNIDGLTAAFDSHKQTYIPDWLGNPPSDTRTKVRGTTIILGTASVDNLNLAPRLAAALNNAVSICKAQAPASNQPF